MSVPVETGFRIGIGEPKGTKHFHSISRTVRQRTHRQRKLWQRQWQWQRSEQRQRNLHQRQAGQPHTPSPLARAGADDVKSEPMDMVCSNNNANANDEHSNDSTGEHDANRSSSGDGGKGSLR